METVDLYDGKVILANSDNKDLFNRTVVKRFIRGGSSVTIEQLPDKKYIFTLKGINVGTDENGTAGQKYYNIALEAEREEKESFKEFVVYALTSYDKLIKRINEIVKIIADNKSEKSYSIDVEKLRELFDETHEFSERNIDDILRNPKLPKKMNGEAFGKMIRSVNSGDIDRRYTLIIFERDKGYFKDMYEENRLNAKYMFLADGNVCKKNLISENPELVAAAVVAGAVCIGVGVLAYRYIKKKKRRNLR